MSEISFTVIRKAVLLLLSALICFSLCGCSAEEKPQEEVPVIDDGDEAQVIEDDPIEYIETYPRTKIDFTYSTLYEGMIDPKGKARILVVPMKIEGGEPMDDAFFDRVKMWINGPYDSRYCLDVRRYYQNASYGQFDLECDIMPVYDLGITLEEWTEGERLKKFKYLYAQEAVEYAVDHYVSDPGIYDSDSDGYLDGVICITNEPYDVEHVSCAPKKSDHDAEMSAANARMRIFVDITPYRFNYATDYMSNTVAHELAHCFGIEDYYDYSWMNSFATYLDLQSATYGDWNPFSKMAVGWIDPYVITPDIEKVSIRLRNSAEYPDAILIPCGDWNGTPFDEYILIDVLADRGNNELVFDSCYKNDDVYDSSGDKGGVRIYHVDARLMKRTHYSGEGLGWFDDFSGSEKYSQFDVCGAYTNSTVTADMMDDSPDRNPDYHLLSLIPANRERIETDFNFYSSYLFHTGAVFSMERYRRFFPNYPYTNKYAGLDYKVTVDSFDDKTKEAVITIEKLH